MPEIGHVFYPRKSQWPVSLPVCGPCGQRQVSLSDKNSRPGMRGPKNLLNSHHSLNSGYSEQAMSTEEDSKNHPLQPSVQVARKSKAFGVKLPRSSFSLCDLSQGNLINPPCQLLETGEDASPGSREVS